jgi:thioredoxin reductase (NADPH)
VAVPLVLAEQWMTGMTGTEFLARVKDVMPTARRGLLISWFDRSASRPILEASALGRMEFYLLKPTWSPDEHFHRVITESLEEWWRERGERFEVVTVIGEEPSVRIHEIRDMLARNSIPFGFYRSDSEEGRQVLGRLGVGQPAGPVVALNNGMVLVNPGNAEVAEALGADVRPSRQAYDVVIVGARPAGLAAAVYAASEGLATALLEREAFGGQAGTSSRIRNHLGFPRGVSGAELAWRAYEQAWVFGTHFVYGNPATSLAAEENLHLVTLQDGSQLRSCAVIVATGVSYRRLGIAALESLVGAGVFYGASTIEAQAVAGKPAFVVGGGNSGGQAALHLSKYAEQGTILVRLQSLVASMSHAGAEPRAQPDGRRGEQLHAGHGRVERWLVARVSDRVEYLPDGRCDADMTGDVSHCSTVLVPAAPWVRTVCGPVVTASCRAGPRPPDSARK